MENVRSLRQQGQILVGLKQLRVARGMPQRKLAETINVSPGVISHYETRKHGASDYTIKKICEALDVTREELKTEAPTHYQKQIKRRTGVTLPGLKSVREEQGLTQQQLANKVGKHEATICRLEAENRKAKPGLRKQLCAALNVPEEALTLRYMSDHFASVFVEPTGINVWGIAKTQRKALLTASHDFIEVIDEVEADQSGHTETHKHDIQHQFLLGLRTFPLTAKALAECNSGNRPERLELCDNMLILKGE